MIEVNKIQLAQLVKVNFKQIAIIRPIARIKHSVKVVRLYIKR